MNLFKVLGVCLGLIVSGCGQSSKLGSLKECEESSSVYPCERPLAAIVSSPASYDGKYVRTAGFLGGGQTRNMLFLSRESWSVGDRYSSVKLSVDPAVHATEYSFVVVSGVLRMREELRQPKALIDVVEPSSIVRMYTPSVWSEHERERMGDGG